MRNKKGINDMKVGDIIQSEEFEFGIITFNQTENRFNDGFPIKVGRGTRYCVDKKSFLRRDDKTRGSAPFLITHISDEFIKTRHGDFNALGVYAKRLDSTGNYAFDGEEIYFCTDGDDVFRAEYIFLVYINIITGA